MMVSRRQGGVFWGVMISAMVFMPGCGAPSAGFERYIPDEARAQEALDRTLAAWKLGGPTKRLALTDPAVTIEVADGSRRPGQRLIDYQIVGEVSADGPRCYVVRLTLEEPSQQLDTRYYVAGIDPLWVFRQEDYDLIMHWEKCEDDAIDDAQNTADAAPRAVGGPGA